MSLDISIGRLAWCVENGELEGAEWAARDLREINRVLGTRPAHHVIDE